MKISLALLILLLAAAWTGSQGMSFHSSRAKCCSKFHPRKILESKIEGYQYTPSSCNLRAVLVKLRHVKQRWVCVDPEEGWFQKYLKKQIPNNTAS